MEINNQPININLKVLETQLFYNTKFVLIKMLIPETILRP